MEARKRSRMVVLTLAGLAGGAYGIANAVSEQDEMRRNLYPDRAACERDYSPAQCQPNSSSGSGGHGGSFYHGPYYHANRGTASALSDPGPGRTGQIVRTQISTRGGFGAFGRAMRAVG